MLAIVVPYYKFTFFEETLQSLASQTDKRFKVYIGDDASIENPNVLLKKFQRKFNFVYHRFEENLGGTSLVKQWERCIELSNDEEWLMILGDDDVLGENVVEAFYANLLEIEKERINVVRFASQLIDGSGVAISGLCIHPKLEKSTDFIIKKINKQTRSSLSEYVFEKEHALKIGFKNFPLGWYADDMAILDYSNYNLIYTINESRLLIRYDSYSLSGNDCNKIEKDIAKFSFFWLLYSQKIDKFNPSQVSLLRRYLLASFLNRIFIKHYLKILYYSINTGSFGLFVELNYGLLNYLKHESKIKQ
ncbi:glycosyltransferase family 2 protein [Flavobacterium petrolei]|uniref:Glycosyltransferase family 2 protein n=1 Tax=Flavobacterium petrolei TaxID=2259594 RepID=A0A482TID4_9FLAO|nr:glycosyltransferase family 2 protein [Flavobacterium petrolei]RYJ50877.1 glycosyltransferase family 2 protein [Flavobacterium petrolei]